MQAVLFAQGVSSVTSYLTNSAFGRPACYFLSSTLNDKSLQNTMPFYYSLLVTDYKYLFTDMTAMAVNLMCERVLSDS